MKGCLLRALNTIGVPVRIVFAAATCVIPSTGIPPRSYFCEQRGWRTDGRHAGVLFGIDGQASQVATCTPMKLPMP